jgi:lipoate-protein ligase B
MEERGLEAYLLGTLDWDSALAIKRRLAHQVAGDCQRSAVFLHELGPVITVGRQGSSQDIGFEPQELDARFWRVQWISRGGGSLLHLPGQVQFDSILSLAARGWRLDQYLDRLRQVVHDLLQDFQITGRWSADGCRYLVDGRALVYMGVSVREWVTGHGLVINVGPDLELMRRVRLPDSKEKGPTSLERERGGPLRHALVRERVIEHYARRFEIGSTSIFFDHPWLTRKVRADALAART